MEKVNKTLADLVKDDFRTAAVLEQFGLDFCCMGTQQLTEACTASGVDVQLVKAALAALGEDDGEVTNFNAWPVDMLVDHIYDRHHRYIEENAPKIKTYLDKICRVHGDRHPELHEVRKLFYEIAGELAVHLKKEELMLFPYIRKLARAGEGSGAVSSPLFRTVGDPVAVMMADHTHEGEKLRQMALYAQGYTIPPDACATYTATYRMLQEFERDIHVHIHLENNILFPKAIELEAVLKATG
jgi:regulator of cell morphogenesis and NO signaling